MRPPRLYDPSRPVIYTTNQQELPDGRIMAADFMDGSFDVTVEGGLATYESNVFTLTALGYTALQTAEITRMSQTAVTNRLAYVGHKLQTTNLGIAKTVTTGFDKAVFEVARPSSAAPTLTPRQLDLWQAISLGISDDTFARKLTMSSRNVRKMTSSLLHELGVVNKASASLLKGMVVPGSDQPNFLTSTSDKGSYIQTLGFKGGLLTIYTEDSLTRDESNILIMQVAGLTRSEVQSVLARSLDKKVPFNYIHTISSELSSKYNARNLVAALSVAVHAGQFVLERECVTPAKSLTDREHQTWKLLAQGLSSHEIADALGIMPKTVVAHTYKLYKILQVSNRSSAALRYHMTYPARTILPYDSTYELRQGSGKVLPPLR